MKTLPLLENPSSPATEANLYADSFVPTADNAPEIDSSEQINRHSIGKHALVATEASLYKSESSERESVETIRVPVTEFDASSRSEKEMSDDNYLVGENFAAVCDGVGSSKHGGIASKLAVNLLAEHLPTVNQLPSRKAAVRRVRKILKTAHKLALNEQKATKLSMASTATTLNYIVAGSQTYAIIGNVGDSPAYLSRSGKLREITGWHDKKLPKPAKRPALGKKMDITPEVYVQPVKPGDTIILTSNGVRKRDQSLKKTRKIARKTLDPSDTAQSMTRLTGPSHDDITTVVSRYVGTATETDVSAKDRYVTAA